MKKIQAIALILFMAILCGATVIQAADTEVQITGSTVEHTQDFLQEGYTLCGENDTLALYVDAQTTMFYVIDKRNGFEWHSNPPGRMEDTFSVGLRKMEMSALLNIVYCQKSNGNENYINSYTGCVMDGNFQIGMIENGFEVVYQFKEIGLSVPLKVWIQDEALKVCIESEKILLADEDVFVQRLVPLQYFCAGGASENGYLFVPDGSGALIGFDNGKYSCGEYSREVYGRDMTTLPSEYDLKENDVKLSLPVFGIKRDENACLAVLEQGAELADIKANTAFQVTSYANVYSSYTLYTKMDYELAKNKTVLYEGPNDNLTDISLCYYFMVAEDANYSGMARCYRQILEGQDALPDTKRTDSPCYITLYGGVAKDVSRLGISTQQVEPLTTLSEVSTIVAKMQDAGIQDIIVQYVNWNAQEMRGDQIEQIRISKNLGSLDDLIQLCRREDMSFYPALTNMLTYRKKGLFSGNAALNLTGSPVLLHDYSLSLGQITEAPSRYLQTLPRLLSRVEKVAASVVDTKAGLIGLDDLGQYLYNDFRDKGSNRTDAQQIITQALTLLDKTESAILLEAPNLYALYYADDLIDIPLTSSCHNLIDCSVPFYQMLISGTWCYGTTSLNLEPATESVLKMLETGSQPHFSGYYRDASLVKGTDLSYLCNGNYQAFLENMAQLYQTARAVYASCGNRRIYSHNQVADGVYETVYENGTAVYVNYTDADYSAGELTVEAKGYAVLQMEGT